MIPFEIMTMLQSQYFDFGDKRLDKRALYSIEKLIKSNCHEGFPGIFQDQYDLKAFYRLMNNERVTPEKFARGYNLGTQQIIRQYSQTHQGEAPLEFYQFQDTTYGSYLHRKKLDLGYIENPTDNGLVLHSALLTDHQFTPLGISSQQVILRNRDDYQKGHQRKQRTFMEKESSKWVKALEWSVKIQEQHHVRIIHVADREGDMKELFNYAIDNELDVIVRSRHDRIVLDVEEKIWTRLRKLPCMEIITRPLLDAQGKPYQAQCAISWTEVQLKGINQVINVVYLKQLDHLDKSLEETEWAIFTTLKLKQTTDAVKIIDIYTHRWRTCEDFHKCLKSGCKIEQRQFESAHAMVNCVSILSITALHLLRMRHLATLDDQPIEQLLDAQQFQLAQLLADQHLKPIDLTHCQPNTARWFTLILGRMGGHQGIRQKGLPGWKNLWRGWYDFKKLMDGIILSKNFFKPT